MNIRPPLVIPIGAVFKRINPKMSENPFFSVLSVSSVQVFLQEQTEETEKKTLEF